MSERPAIGIDFGTTKTLASRWDDRSQGPVAIRLGRGTDEIPTTVHVDRKGNYSFGEDAEDQRVTDPKGYFRRIKRDLGRNITHTLPNGQSATSTELIVRFLRHVRERVEAEALHGPVGHTVITVPALYGPAARADLKAAADQAGFTDFALLEEPIAGGSAFLHAHPTSISGRNFAVFDWGGGTLDLAVIERNGEVLKAHPDLIGGDPELGGEHIDDDIETEVSKYLVSIGKSRLDQQPEEHQIGALRALKVGKQLMSRKTSHVLRLNLQDGPVDLECTRKMFEGFVVAAVDRAVAHLTRLLAKCSSAGVEVNGVLLIGGSSEIPMVARLIEESTGLKSYSYDRRQSAVGLGAMLHAHRRTPLPPVPVNGQDVEQAISLESFQRGLKVEITTEVAGQPVTVRVHIPANAIQGQRLRCGGLGMPGLNGGANGDLVLLVAELNPPVDRALKSAYEVASELDLPAAPAPVDGSDLRREHEVAPHTSLERQVWIGTRRVNFTAPVDFANGHILRLVGEGEEGKNGGASGDLLVVLRKAEAKFPMSPTLHPTRSDSNQAPIQTVHTSPVAQKGEMNETLKIVFICGGVAVLGLGGVFLIATVFGIPFGIAAFWAFWGCCLLIRIASAK